MDFNKGLSIKDVRSQGGGDCPVRTWGKGGFQMRTSALFSAKSIRFFYIYGVSARTRGWRWLS